MYHHANLFSIVAPLNNSYFLTFGCDALVLCPRNRIGWLSDQWSTPMMCLAPPVDALVHLFIPGMKASSQYLKPYYWCGLLVSEKFPRYCDICPSVKHAWNKEDLESSQNVVLTLTSCDVVKNHDGRGNEKFIKARQKSWCERNIVHKLTIFDRERVNSLCNVFHFWIQKFCWMI